MQIPGVLEIDNDRGVIYFHTDDPETLRVYGTCAILRICGLGQIPQAGIDITILDAGIVQYDKQAIVSFAK